MSDNPLEDSPDREARIRERAYLLWEQDGCPHGRADEYWERARELIGMEDSRGAGLLPNPATQHETLPGVIVDEAALQENLGEFPSLLTDQGDRPQTPAPRKAAIRVVSKVASKPAGKAAKSAKAADKPAGETPAKRRTTRTSAENSTSAS
jgi:hypothetical protein